MSALRWSLQLLAALLFMRNPGGVKFFDPDDRRSRNYTEITTRNVPIKKTRFGCSIDLSLALQGYDVAHQLQQHVEAFYNSAPCDQGFVEVNPAILKLKNEWEFPTGYPISDMPSLKDYRISIMYRSFSGDAELFDISFQTAIKHIPYALELVVVVEEVDKDLFEQLLVPHHESATFPLRVVTEPSIMDGHIQQKYSKVSLYIVSWGDTNIKSECQSGLSAISINRQRFLLELTETCFFLSTLTPTLEMVSKKQHEKCFNAVRLSPKVYL